MCSVACWESCAPLYVHLQIYICSCMLAHGACVHACGRVCRCVCLYVHAGARVASESTVKGPRSSKSPVLGL